MSFTIQIINNNNGNIVRSLTMSDKHVQALKDSLQGEIGILDWLIKVVQGKINRCNKRMRKRWISKFIEEGVLPPPNNDDFAALIATRDDYKDREARDLDDQLREV